MLLEELNEVVRAALATGADENIDRAGRSEYDIACEIVKSEASGDNSDQVVMLLIAVAKDNLDRQTNWWLSFFSMFEELVFLPRARLEILQFFLRNPPKAPEVRAYALRFLSYLGIQVKWNALPQSFDPTALSLNYPLVIADAFVWARRYDDAREVLARALSSRTASSADVAGMVERWLRVARPADITLISALGRSEALPKQRPHSNDPPFLNLRISPADRGSD